MQLPDSEAIHVRDATEIPDLDSDIAARRLEDIDDAVVGVVLVHAEQPAGPVIHVAVEIGVAVAIDDDAAASGGRPDPHVSVECASTRSTSKIWAMAGEAAAATSVATRMPRVNGVNSFFMMRLLFVL